MLIASHTSPSELKVSCNPCNPSFVILHVSSTCLLSLLKEDKIEGLSQQQDEEEAPEEPNTYQEEVTYEQPGDLLLEQTDYLTEPQALGCQQAQTPEVLNGGSHQGEHSPSQKGVCGFMGFCASAYSLCEGMSKCECGHYLFCMILLCSSNGHKDFLLLIYEL